MLECAPSSWKRVEMKVEECGNAQILPPTVDKQKDRHLA
jgi:hypothetical protein